MNVIQIENLWKEYRLGVIGHGTLTHDLQSWWARVRGKEDPNASIIPMLAGQEEQVKGDHFWALRDINLEIKQGEIVGIIGSNGAGKSTLLKILSRITVPSRGSLRLKGKVASLLEVGTGFHPELTGRENIFLNGLILGMAKKDIQSKLDEIVEFSEVSEYINTPVKRYSSGMRVRLAFSVAAFLEPEILIIDEVLAVGDIAFQKRCLHKIEDINKSGKTILLVSHNMGVIRRVCQKGIVLSSGEVTYNGNIDNAIDHYISLETGLKSCVNIHRNKKNEKQDTAILLQIKVKDIDDVENVSYDVRCPVVIELLYEIIRDDVNVDAVYFFKNMFGAGDIIFMSTTMHEKKNNNIIKNKGKYLSRCTIPGNFLAEGQFSITAILCTFNEHSKSIIHDKHDDVVTIEVYDSIEGDSARVNHSGVYHGVVRPVFDWKTVKYPS